ncbi:MAG TPA: hypothetical protein VKM55_06815 [Candidatus Lokiarchaeia archaeon]|nr:hypothetical protein [Candidatus Lokiarchaeia archaeon]
MIDAYNLVKLIFGEIAAGLLFLGFAIIFQQYARKRYRPSFFLAFSWFGFFLEALFGATSLIFEKNSFPELILLKLSYLSLTPGFLGVLALIDSISRDSIEPKKFIMLVFVLGADSIIICISPDDLMLIIPYIIVVSIGLFISLANLVLYIQIYRKVPPYLKKLGLANVFGAFFVAVLYVTVNIMESIFPTLPPISRMFEAFGALIQASIFSRYEQLFYILPFKAHKLIVFNTQKGLSIFMHEWSKLDHFIDEDLFTSILQGMSMIVNESLKQGNVQEIKLEQGVLLVSHDSTYPVACVLIASKTSQVLRDGLADFERKFVAKFEANIVDSEYSNTLQGADDLVKSCFPFIPQFN